MAGDSYSNSQPSLPLHLCFFLGILLMFVSFSWYINHEPVLDSVFDQLKLVFIASPLLLLLVMRCLPKGDHHRQHSFPILRPQTDSVLGEGGTPWGVGLVLALLFLMISYQSYFHERWFPLLSR